MIRTHSPITRSRALHSLTVAIGSLFVIGFIIVGLIGFDRYIWTYTTYRGFPAPLAPSTVQVGHAGSTHAVPVEQGVLKRFNLVSKAIGRQEPVYVFLPPGYANSTQRYPVFYLLHGVPGTPLNFINAGNVVVDEEILIAQHRMAPMILVMATGAPGSFQDTEWANGVHRYSAWETYLARDVVDAVDARFRTIPTGAGRAIGGYSEGAYGALNIAIHHPNEFHLVESWSGYMSAYPIPAIFGANKKTMADNSPKVTITKVTQTFKRNGTYIWLYCGKRDETRFQNQQFAAHLTRLGLPHQFTIWPNIDHQVSRHNWRLWRNAMPQALIVASEHVTNE